MPGLLFMPSARGVELVIMQTAAILSVILLALTHVSNDRFRFLSGSAGRYWLSFGGGIAVGYVFMHLLPDIADAREAYLNEPGIRGLLAEHLFLLMMLGLVVYYGIDRLESRFTVAGEHVATAGRSRRNVMLHASGYAVYNFLIGYLVTNLPRPGMVPLLLITGVMLLHFIGLDFHFRHMKPVFYDRRLRWVFSLSLLLGGLLGTQFHISLFIKAVCFAFLSGAILINTIKEELPDDEQASFAAFCAGIVLMVVVVMLLDGFFPKIY